jgi:hypothetical protein
VRDEYHRDPEVLRQVLHELQDLRLDRDVERGRRLVGDDELRVAREPDRDHDALAHAAGELVGILVESALGIGNADHLQELGRAFACSRHVHAEVDQQRLHDLEADGEHRVERGHRLLEDHRDVAPAYLAHLVVRQLQEIATLEEDPPADDPPGGLRKQPHDRERRDRFSASRFADERDHFTGANGIGDAFHRAHYPARGDEVDVQVFDFEQPGTAGRRVARCDASDRLVHPRGAPGVVVA